MKIRLLLLTSIFALTGCATFVVEENTKSGSSSSRQAPNFNLPNYQGEMISLKNLKGTPMVLNSWASWCIFCVDELPDFARIQEEFGDQVKFVAINRRESLSRAKTFSDELQITDKMIFLLDPEDFFYREIGGFSMPETLFVDADGNVVEHYRGKLTEEQVREKIQNIL